MRRPGCRRIGATFVTGILLACRPESPPSPPAPVPVPATAEPEEPLAMVPAPPEPAPAPVAAPDAFFSGPDQAPAGLPDDLPLYTGAVPISSMSSPSRGTIVNLRSIDASEPIFTWYRDELPRRGWLLDKQSGAGGQHLVTAHKDGRKATVLLRPGGEGGTQILLTVAPGQ